MTGHPRVFGDTFYLLSLFSLFLRFNSPLSLSLSLSSSFSFCLSFSYCLSVINTRLPYSISAEYELPRSNDSVTGGRR